MVDPAQRDLMPTSAAATLGVSVGELDAVTADVKRSNTSSTPINPDGVLKDINSNGHFGLNDVITL